MCLGPDASSIFECAVIAVTFNNALDYRANGPLTDYWATDYWTKVRVRVRVKVGLVVR